MEANIQNLQTLMLLIDQLEGAGALRGVLMAMPMSDQVRSSSPMCPYTNPIAKQASAEQLHCRNTPVPGPLRLSSWDPLTPAV